MVAEPCAWLELVALGMNTIVIGALIDDVAALSGKTAMLELALPMVYAAPQGIVVNILPAAGVANWRPLWHWYKNAYEPVELGVYFQLTVIGVPDVAVAGAVTTIVVFGFDLKREENHGDVSEAR